MANTSKPGPTGAHHHHHPRHRRHPHPPAPPQKALPPPRTPGPLGRNDQADPLLTTLLGCTPNLSGVRDWADETIKEVEHLWHKALGAIGYDKQVGAPVAHGSPPALPANGQLTLEEAHLLTLRITSVFEGEHGKSMDYAALANDFDGQGTSFGIVQFNFGRGTLGPLLNKMRNADTAKFDSCFSADADFDTLKALLPQTGKATWHAQRAWALDRFKTPEGTRAWRAAFKAIGTVDAFNKLQVDAAIDNYNPIVEKDIQFLRTLAPVPMAKVEFRSYAALFDCAIQQGGLSKAADQIRSKVASDKPATQLALLTIAVTERANAANADSVADCLNRRMSILNGKNTKATANGITRHRDNSQYGIVLTEGAKVIAGL